MTWTDLVGARREDVDGSQKMWGKKGGYIGKNERGKSWQRGGGARDSENERVCVRMGLTEKNTQERLV